MKIKFALLIVILVGLAGFSACSRPQSGSSTLQIKGSDTMVNLGQAWAEDYMKKKPGISVAVTGGGSGTGIAALISNSCDIAEISREMKKDEIEMARKNGIEPHEIPVALDGLAVVVNPKNPISQLTMDQLAQIFSGAVKNWKDIGGPDMQIVVLSREVNSGTHVYFKEHVLRHGNPNGKEEFAPSALLMPSSQAIADEVSQNTAAIGYYGMGYISAKEKAIAIAKDAASPYVEPTVDNVVNKTYPISRPLYIVTKGQQSQGTVADYVNFVLSPEGQQIVSKLEFVPIKK